MPRRRTQVQDRPSPAVDLAAAGLVPGPVRDWFAETFPAGPTPAQKLAWPAVGSGENLLLISPTGTGKTLAAFLAILQDLFAEHAAGTLAPGLRCVYLSPLRSLGYDIERNLAGPLEALRTRPSASRRARCGSASGPATPRPTPAASCWTPPPHLLITTPESPPAEPAVVARALGRGRPPDRRRGAPARPDEAAGPTWRSRSNAWSWWARRDPVRLGARPPAGRLLSRSHSSSSATAGVPGAGGVSARGEPHDRAGSRLALGPDEAPHRGLTYRRQRRVARETARNCTTVVFANTRRSPSGSRTT
ncbi:MAG: DEAD/DEAH box helicase [Isosphaeraceae bacterium]